MIDAVHAIGKPTVLFVISKNSTLSVLQDAGVQIVFVDERVDPEWVVMVPPVDQKEQLLLTLADMNIVSLDDDVGKTAANALAQLYRQRLLISRLEPDQLNPPISARKAAQ